MISIIQDDVDQIPDLIRISRGDANDFNDLFWSSCEYDQRRIARK